MSEAGDETRDLRGPLESWLSRRLPEARDLRVSGLRAPGAGDSSDTSLFAIDYEAAGQRHHLDVVLRCAPHEGGPFPEYDMGMQFHVMRVLGQHGVVPVPEVLWLEEDASALGVPFLVMRAVAGDAPLDRPPYHGEGIYCDADSELRAHIWDVTVESVARLHEADWKALFAGFVPGTRAGEDPARVSLEYWRRYLEDFLKTRPDEVVPVYDAALDYLERERPEPERLALCWGDAKLGNVLYAPETRDLAAMLDWEMASIGNPEADLASLHLSDLRAQDGGGRCLPGTPDAEELVALYEAHTGRPVRNFHYHMVFATFWRGSVQVAVMRQLRAQGVDIPDEMFENNFVTNKLRELLGD